ncbi:MAG: secondary thiamine-phosphate synthase enzyme YjbQ [Gammaproteobacteria bacterium]
MQRQESFDVPTRGRGTINITARVAAVIARSGVTTGLCHIFVAHTSASLILNENADPDVRVDLEAFMSRLVPDGDSIYRHTLEGPDDMAAHVRTTLTDSALTIPVSAEQPGLGTWQGVFLWEHRHQGSHRRVTVTVQGE